MVGIFVYPDNMKYWRHSLNSKTMKILYGTLTVKYLSLHKTAKYNINVSSDSQEQ